ncbi:MAG: ABC transporter ATP-binding protein [Myxococcales bacterium]|nr:ABC transporter ATP-binding protein [Myxococcales bacterium]
MPTPAARGHATHATHAATHATHATPHQRLRELVRLERDDIWAIAVFGALVGLTTLAVPVAVQALVTSVAMGTLLQPVAVLTVLLTIVLGFSAALRVWQVKLVELLQERVFVRASLELASKLSHASPGAFEGRHGPEQVNRFLDVVTVQKALAGLLLDGLAVGLQLVVGLGLLGFYHPLLLAFDVVLIGALIFVIFVLGRRGVSTSVGESKAKYAVVAWLQEVARHPVAFRSENAQRFALARADERLMYYLERRREHFRVVLRQTIGSLTVHTFASASVLGLGALLVLQSQLTLGQLVASELVVNAVVAGVSKLGKHLETYYDVVTSLDKLGHLTEISTEREDGEPLEGSGPLRVELERASGRVAVRAGECLVLSAARQETSGELGALYGLAEDADVRVDGVPLTEVSLPSYRDAVALVRGPEVFNGSVLDNVRMGRPNVSQSDVRRALAAVGLEDTVARLPAGLNTELTTYGLPLTSEQGTRIALARGLAGGPRLLLLDRVLDGLPEAALAAVVSTLVGARGTQSLVVSTSRPDVATALSATEVRS